VRLIYDPLVSPVPACPPELVEANTLGFRAPEQENSDRGDHLEELVGVDARIEDEVELDVPPR
jgi:hypothetical protein